MASLIFAIGFGPRETARLYPVAMKEDRLGRRLTGSCGQVSGACPLVIVCDHKPCCKFRSAPCETLSDTLMEHGFRDVSIIDQAEYQKAESQHAVASTNQSTQVGQ